MKRCMSALFMHLRVGVGAGMLFLAVAYAVQAADGWEVSVFANTAIGLPLALSGLAEMDRRKVSGDARTA